ncbi:hypothetical protein HanIR_Chr11g0503581 [Helianthus annuus]|nr:hypothetical protein HanIR_Chr11g0503581 [Helianthus annuus]
MQCLIQKANYQDIAYVFSLNTYVSLNKITKKCKHFQSRVYNFLIDSHRRCLHLLYEQKL